jgi:hypothetical protein
MSRILRALLFWTFILCACSPGPSSPGGLPSQAGTADSTFAIVTATSNSPTAVVVPPSPTLTPVLPPTLIATVSTPNIDQSPNVATTVPPSNPQDCGYQWAQQALPELSSQFQQSIQTLQPEAQAYAFAFGENCMHADGSATFLPMETDFNVTLQVSDLSNETDLGEWIVKVMQVIQNIPPDQIVGPRPGRVTISFQSGAAQQYVNFYIDQCRALQPGLSNAEIYKALRIPQ